ncbi:hypothetical protein [Pedobacter psychroterrae]|uniref:HTH cro/C1-type domain-containing protein n=1 Tax=Pedobacter psychroterrae TaxID=2530453 RepID=A0A4R0NPY2_9SPHI|nr:hypothetical protein [Pedobacter psychroterrae]TCD03090.1 hypothetical protein EZ437_03680 [Pedobacter psychroterrae]
MLLKSVVDELLKEKNRPMSWLAEEMGKTFDGLKLSLTRESIKYNDIIAMAKILEVSVNVLFPEEPHKYSDKKNPNFLGEPKAEYSSAKNELKNCREMLAALKDQIKDKDKIISLLSKGD